jgi:hydroxypyruvate isomerase
MARFAPNLYHQFLELPTRRRFAAVREAGFDAIEWHFPYELPRDELRTLLRDNGLTFVNAVTPVDWTKEKGLAAQPGREADFKRAAAIGLDYALHCDFKTLHPGPGQIPPGVERARCIDTFVRNLDDLCGQALGSSLTLVIEGVCNARFPNYVLQTMNDAIDVVKLVNRPNLKVVYDTFHLRHEEKGPLVDILERSWDYIGHIQIGNAPIRYEPGVGELDLFYLIDRIDAKGFQGWIGLEFDPSKDTWSSLTWANRYGYAVSPAMRPPDAGPVRPRQV